MTHHQDTKNTKKHQDKNIEKYFFIHSLALSDKNFFLGESWCPWRLGGKVILTNDN